MQLSKQKVSKSLVNKRKIRSFKKIAPALAAASCSLLSLASNTALARGEAGTWDFEAASLLYSESDDRVSAAEPVFSATRNFEDGEVLNLKAAFDALTGASPNGATPSALPQTFTTPSGNSLYITDAGDDPIDDTFRDTRVALSASWLAPINRDWEYNAAVYGSKEYDYLSVGSSGGIKRYLNNKNTALNAGLSFSFDTIEPEGNIAKPLAKMGFNDTDFNASRDGASDSKTIIDALFGVTQVINRNTIMQFNYSLSVSDGYLTDPFKVLSVIEDTAGANFGGNLQDGNGDNIYLYEARPDSRIKHSLYWQTKYALANGDVIDGSYRFMLDDWGINSHTFDFRYRWQLGSSYLEPHFRYYLQSEADFYKRYITETEYNAGSPTLTEATSDYRLGDLDGMTVGLKFGHKMDNDHEFNMRVEYYLQSNSGDSGIGLLKDQDLYPDTKAIIFQVGYSF
jgi:hypothetical protein